MKYVYCLYESNVPLGPELSSRTGISLSALQASAAAETGQGREVSETRYQTLPKALSELAEIIHCMQIT